MSNDELYDLIEEVQDKIPEIIFKANRIGNLEDLLLAMGLENLCQKQSFYETYKDGKIVVIGQSEVKKEVLLAIAKKLGLDKSRFEFHLEYNDAIKFQYRKLNYNPNYRLVMFGPIPHSTSGKGNSSNAIAEMENTNGYPKIVRLISNQQLKITKHNFEENLQKLIDENYL